MLAVGSPRLTEEVAGGGGRVAAFCFTPEQTFLRGRLVTGALGSQWGGGGKVGPWRRRAEPCRHPLPPGTKLSSSVQDHSHTQSRMSISEEVYRGCDCRQRRGADCAKRRLQVPEVARLEQNQACGLERMGFTPLLPTACVSLGIGIVCSARMCKEATETVSKEMLQAYTDLVPSESMAPVSAGRLQKTDLQLNPSEMQCRSGKCGLVSSPLQDSARSRRPPFSPL